VIGEAGRGLGGDQVSGIWVLPDSPLTFEGAFGIRDGAVVVVVAGTVVVVVVLVVDVVVVVVVTTAAHATVADAVPRVMTGDGEFLLAVAVIVLLPAMLLLKHFEVVSPEVLVVPDAMVVPAPAPVTAKVTVAPANAVRGVPLLTLTTKHALLPTVRAEEAGVMVTSDGGCDHVTATLPSPRLALSEVLTALAVMVSVPAMVPVKQRDGVLPFVSVIAAAIRTAVFTPLREKVTVAPATFTDGLPRFTFTTRHTLPPVSEPDGVAVTVTEEGSVTEDPPRMPFAESSVARTANGHVVAVLENPLCHSARMSALVSPGNAVCPLDVS
jgi:hypothetical protein